MPIERLKETPSQTAGPYVHIGTYPVAAGLAVRSQERPEVMAGPDTKGERIRIEGMVRDGAGSLVRDAMLELWQADADGRWGENGFGFGRAVTDFATGLYAFETVKPGATMTRDGRPQAPYATLLVFARGINIHLHTRIYFDDAQEANAADPTLKAVGDPRLARTLVATRQVRGGETVYRFDIVLQGEDETVFFDI
jgi:protocatechuate 3,4-dioxygenase alpha subunit